jgi:ribosomal subunit interface protein
MQVLVRAKDFQITEGIQAFAEKQAQKLSRGAMRLIRVETFLEKTRAYTTATIRAVLPGKDVVVAKSATDSYAALQTAFDRLTEVVRERNERRHKKRKNGRG